MAVVVLRAIKLLLRIRELYRFFFDLALQGTIPLRSSVLFVLGIGKISIRLLELPFEVMTLLFGALLLVLGIGKVSIRLLELLL